MNGNQKTFVFLSDVVGISVVDAVTGRPIGRVTDVAAALREMYPRISGVVLRNRADRQRVYVAWKDVQRFDPGARMFVNVTPETLQRGCLIPDTEILLKETFWDKQIVDIHGSKVVRVNDLHLLNEGLNLWVVHMDVGMSGLLRRLGCLPFINYFARLISSCEIADRLISWKFVQPVVQARGSEALALKVHHSQLTELAPGDMADILAELGTDERIAVLKTVDAATAASSLQALPLKIQLQIAELMDPKDLLSSVQEMAVADIANLLSELPRKRSNAILSKLPPDKAAQVTDLLGQSTRTVQRIMGTSFVATTPDATAAMVIEQIRKEHKKRDFTQYVYVLGEGRVVHGVVSLHQLLIAPPERAVSDLMRKRLTKVTLDMPVRAVAKVFYKHDFTVVPVVDRQNRMMGVVTMKDAFAAVVPEIREEVTR